MKKIILLAIAGAIALSAWFIYNSKRVVVPPIDKTKSEIGWSGKSITDTHTGKIQLSKAELRFENDVLIGGMFEADMKSITVTDITEPEENQKLVSHISDADFFEVEKYPVATFTMTAAKPLGNDAYEVSGNMKIKDKEHPISFKTQITKTEHGKNASATVSIDRTKYGIEYGAQGKPGSEKDWFILNDFLLQINIVVAGG